MQIKKYYPSYARDFLETGAEGNKHTRLVVWTCLDLMVRMLKGGSIQLEGTFYFIIFQKIKKS